MTRGSRRSRSKSVSPEKKKSKRSRSRSKDREKPSRSNRHRRSRSRDREERHRHDRKDGKRERSSRSKRSRSRDRNRSRSRGRDYRDRDRDREPKPEAKEPVVDPLVSKEEEQKRLDLEMMKRRERIEKWRAERKKKELEDAKSEISKSNLVLPSKAWTLEDDSDEEEDKNKVKQEGEEDGEEAEAEKKNGVAEVQPEAEEVKMEVAPEIKEEEEEDDVDPLDAYMMTVQEEVCKINKVGKVQDTKEKQNSAQSGVVIMTGTAKKKDSSKSKGELIEQNQDGLEYSSEEESENLQETAAGLAVKQKKELAKVDHSKETYKPFRKNFYVEVPEISKMTQEEVDAYKEELEGIRVKGKGCPRPIKTWAQCGVSKKVLDVLKKQNFEKPTPIQTQAIPAVMSGRDLIGIAKTGSGKTIAFLLPMFRHILDQPPLEDNDGPIAIIMTPTRELCMQIGKDIKKFSKYLALRAVCVYGGTGISEQIAELKRGAEVIVCTPGRMIDMLAANNGRVTNLRRVTYIVLDEADRMFDMGFEPQVMRIMDNVRPDRQTVMFSATFPRQMEALARRILNKPIEVQVGGRSVVCKEVEQNVVVLEEEQKFLKLLELLGLYQNRGSTIVFVDKQENADILLKDLMKAGYNCMSLHGGIDQFDRDSTIVDFKSGKVKLMIATSVAARGLDVKQLILVVNYDCPNHYEDYVHRCGRTGRAGKTGFAYTFITPEQERYSGEIVKAFEQSGVAVPEPLQTLFDRYKAKAAAEGKKVHSGGGFSGKGFKFDDNEAQAVNERKKLQKAALGLQDSDDEDVLNDIDQQIETMLAPKRTIKEIKAPVLGGIALNIANPTMAAVAASAAATADKLELARRLASRINIAKNLGAEHKVASQMTAEAIMKGSSGLHPLITAKTVAEQLAAKLNTKLNYQPKEDEEKIDEFGDQEIFRKYEEELEINDFPQQARWRVTSKEALAQISEYSEAGITVRGTFTPQGKPPPEGERKLYLAIESTSELAVSKAKAEITRLIKEELIKLQSTSHQLVNKSRYKVL
ncbi:probable ATP-dependent RNA helicase DDX46 [Neocloeon triangulifer]|uniref:probable ATP-dependent RNA helicase DDX46 n=1 Tax=Neocloeon triangulifer TaxID=2078957 RepID=UPI00286F77A1|nr:probable ATP-dependent RNA helicase DDX46 [Neocloeon triangulifer]